MTPRTWDDPGNWPAPYPDLPLFDARPACDRCHRHYDGPTWEAIDECSEEELLVCSECAHNFRRKRQRMSAR